MHFYQKLCTLCICLFIHGKHSNIPLHRYHHCCLRSVSMNLLMQSVTLAFVSLSYIFIPTTKVVAIFTLKLHAYGLSFILIIAYITIVTIKFIIIRKIFIIIIIIALLIAVAVVPWSKLQKE